MSYLEYKSIWELYVDLFKKACRKKDYERAQTILENAFIDAHERQELDNRLLWCVYSLGSYYLSCNKDEKAEQLYGQLIELKEKVIGRNHPQFSDGLEQLALLQIRANQPKAPLVIAEYLSAAHLRLRKQLRPIGALKNDPSR